MDKNSKQQQFVKSLLKMNTVSDKERILNQKKAELKTLQEKYELNNKKIKLLRKENQELKRNAEKQSQTDTAMLLQSKQLSDANSKLENAIEELQAKLNEPMDVVIPEIVTIRDVSVTMETLQVDLSSKQLTDEQFGQIEPFVQIQSFILDSNKLTDISVSLIVRKFTSLKKLLLNSNSFTAGSLQALQDLKNLKILQLNGNNLGDQSLGYIKKRSETLTELSLSKNNITDKGAENILELKKLIYLDLNSNNITDEGVKSLLELSHITHLYLGWNKISYYGARWCIKDLKSLEVLDVRFNQLTPEEKQKIKAEKPEALHLFC